MNRVNVTLRENALSFLAEAIAKALVAEEYPEQWKFAIFNLAQSVELSLKEALRLEHESLIFEDADSQKRTVSTGRALKRLKLYCGHKLVDSDGAAVESAIDWRNRIVHFEVDFTPREVKTVFGRLLGFLSEFYTRNLNIRLSDVVPEREWQQAISIMDYGAELLDRAEKQIEEDGFQPPIACHWCGWVAFVTERCTCFVCGHEEDLVECGECGEMSFYEDTDAYQTAKGEVIVCSGCAEQSMRAELAFELASGR